jgi:hypothetical protein
MVWFRSRKKMTFESFKKRVFKTHLFKDEDDPIVADVLGMTLEEAGNFKTTANTIETALSELSITESIRLCSI